MSYDDSDDLAYNPFADEINNEPTGSNVATGYFNSAFFPEPSSPTTTLRRRRSSLSNKSPTKPVLGKKKHTRALSEIEITPHSAGLHPLKSALAATIGVVFQDSGVTRPNLSRLVSEANNHDGPEEEEDTKGPPPIRDEETDVIVHQVTLKDSLAGVSLKYGISLANLRRANQLWTSDSIHRRSELYIPIDQASRAREFLPEPKLISLTPDPPDETINVFDLASSLASPVNGHKAEAPPNSPPAVTRMPARQLTYFPPSTNKSPDIRLNSHSLNPAMASSSNLRTSPTSSKYDPSLPNNSLTSILTALPISASVRDEIITRLSFDSVSSSFTDRSRANSDEDDGHELNEVARSGHLNGLRLGFDEGLDESKMPTPKARPRNAQLPPVKTSGHTSSSSLPKTSHLRSISSASPPRFYVSQLHETSIRTSQMEPSPSMQIPVRRSTTVGPSAGKKHLTSMGRTTSLGVNRVGNGKDQKLDNLASKMQIHGFH
ncbi:hypothetical protein CPB83DRAFT_884302 [Crepidotus variabilis]|uniref:LysM domain-containing protein n=1 Tax=Crepidotus variabilis TaxID=179855 RepID=A0A9P6EE17_9AGAR|nr:hypothetical protein CPB83DRAFT_884302 [Crepidotus variabilis]